MAFGMRCDDCGADTPSLGSLQMHRLRYHTTPPDGPAQGAAVPPAAPDPAPGGAGSPVGQRPRAANGGRGAALPLALAIAVLAAGGAYAAARPRPDDPTGTITTAATTGPTGPTKAELTAAAQRATFAAADFPAGWTVEPSPADDSAHAGDRTLDECLGLPHDDAPNDAESGFSSKGLTASSEFSIAPSLEQARADLDALAVPGAPDCFQKAMQVVADTGKPAGGTFTVKVTRTDPPAALAGQAAAFTATLTMHQGRVTVPATFGMIMIQHGRIEGALTFGSVGKPAFPADLSRSLTDAVANRLAAG